MPLGELLVASLLTQSVVEVSKTLPFMRPMLAWQKFVAVVVVAGLTNFYLTDPSWRSWLAVVGVSHATHHLLRLLEAASDLTRVTTITRQRLTRF